MRRVQGKVYLTFWKSKMERALCVASDCAVLLGITWSTARKGAQRNDLPLSAQTINCGEFSFFVVEFSVLQRKRNAVFVHSRSKTVRTPRDFATVWRSRQWSGEHQNCVTGKMRGAHKGAKGGHLWGEVRPFQSHKASVYFFVFFWTKSEPMPKFVFHESCHNGALGSGTCYRLLSLLPSLLVV